MSKQKRADEGGKPWCIQPELVEGCSMRHGSGIGGLCHFCGLQAIRSGPGNYRYMSLDTASKIADDLMEYCPKPRIEFAMRGEPLMNPDHLKIFRAFRNRLPKAQMMVTTNGDTLRGRLAEKADGIFEAGINFILMDTYYPSARRNALRNEAWSLNTIRNFEIEVVDYFGEWMPEGKSPYHNHGNKIQRTIVLMDDLSARDGEHGSRLVKTHAGSNPTRQITHEFPYKRNCGRPFREMTFTWDGYFTLCCDDWKREYIIGNIDDHTVERLWCHPKVEAARARLMQKDRAWGPCQLCDAPTAPRTGLLPIYDPPTEKQIELTERTFQSKDPLWWKKS